MTTKSLVGSDYAAFLTEVKGRIVSARLHAARAVNRDLINLYWDIGRGIVEKQETLGWGESVVEMLAKDLQEAFPGMRGFSKANLWAMRRFYLEYGRNPILQQLAEELEIKRGAAALKHPVQELRSKARASIGLAGGSEFLQQLVEEIPWGHHLLLLDKVIDPAARLYYLRATAQLGWSRNVLLNQIKAGVYEWAVMEKIDMREGVAA
jgi:predicted nuclease of restriction endonuclease-like (RecB) superfamily